MHPLDVLKVGHQTVLKTIRGLPESEWYRPGVSGYWSVKDVLAHLASHELMVVEVLSTFLGNQSTPTLDRFRAAPLLYNDPEVEKRKSLTPQQVLEEYQANAARALELIQQIPYEKITETGALPWYGPEYDLTDFLTFGVYGHKREHCAQIAAFRDQLVKKP